MNDQATPEEEYTIHFSDGVEKNILNEKKDSILNTIDELKKDPEPVLDILAEEIIGSLKDLKDISNDVLTEEEKREEIYSQIHRGMYAILTLKTLSVECPCVKESGKDFARIKYYRKYFMDYISSHKAQKEIGNIFKCPTENSQKNIDTIKENLSSLVNKIVKGLPNKEEEFKKECIPMETDEKFFKQCALEDSRFYANLKARRQIRTIEKNLGPGLETINNPSTRNKVIQAIAEVKKHDKQVYYFSQKAEYERQLVKGNSYIENVFLKYNKQLDLNLETANANLQKSLKTLAETIKGLELENTQLERDYTYLTIDLFPGRSSILGRVWSRILMGIVAFVQCSMMPFFIMWGGISYLNFTYCLLSMLGGSNALNMIRWFIYTAGVSFSAYMYGKVFSNNRYIYTYGQCWGYQKQEVFCLFTVEAVFVATLPFILGYLLFSNMADNTPFYVHAVQSQTSMLYMACISLLAKCVCLYLETCMLFREYDVAVNMSIFRNLTNTIKLTAPATRLLICTVILNSVLIWYLYNSKETPLLYWVVPKYACTYTPDMSYLNIIKQCFIGQATYE
ncbi:hypothetical protein NECID01_1536 [Nematocida sp. AWRm77]|nr:hypothetical protein NECID01_1536 [Nematocida sp. AWRm77]